MFEGETQHAIMPHLSDSCSIKKMHRYLVLCLRLDLLSYDKAPQGCDWMETYGTFYPYFDREEFETSIHNSG